MQDRQGLEWSWIFQPELGDKKQGELVAFSNPHEALLEMKLFQETVSNRHVRFRASRVGPYAARLGRSQLGPWSLSLSLMANLGFPTPLRPIGHVNTGLELSTMAVAELPVDG